MSSSNGALSRRGALLVAGLGLVAVSHAAIFIRLADAPALTIAFARVALASLVFLPFGLAAARPAGGRGLGTAVAAGAVAGLCLAAHFFGWVAALGRVSIAEATVLVSLSPVWIALFDAATGRGLPDGRLLGAIALCLAGSAVLGLDGLARADGDPLGLALAGLGGVAMAGYLVAGRTARARLPTPAYVALAYTTASVALLVAALATGAALSGFDTRTWAALAALGIVAQVIGHSAYNWTLSTLPPMLVGLCLIGAPVLGALLGLLYLGEAIPPGALGGGALILAGVVLAIVAEARRAAPPR
ncbi:MAG: DMT family transporter [Paracoccaceae bacterium]